MNLFRRFFSVERHDPYQTLRRKSASFRILLSTNHEILEQFADLERSLAAGQAMSVEELRGAAEAIRAKTVRMVESVCGPSLHENSIIFCFKGGAADVQRRERRARFIAEVLEHHGFEVDRRQDLVNAWVKKLPQNQIEELLAMLGRLMGSARQLDVTMSTETRVAACVEAFLKGDYGLQALAEE